MVMLLMVFRNPPVDWWSITLTTRVFTSSVVFFGFLNHQPVSLSRWASKSCILSNDSGVESRESKKKGLKTSCTETPKLTYHMKI